MVELFISRGGSFQPYLMINVTGWVHLGKNLSYSYLRLALDFLLQNTFDIKNWYQFLSLVDVYPLLSCIEKVFKEERNGNRKGYSRGI